MDSFYQQKLNPIQNILRCDFAWKRLLSILCFLTLLYFTLHGVIAEASPGADNTKKMSLDPFDYRIKQERKQVNNPFLISLYKPTYVLPAYYNGAPYYSIYKNNTSDQQDLKHLDFKFQISFKVPVWQDFFGQPNTLYAAYTQQSYWQAYNNSPYFRESNYEPEIFLSNPISISLTSGWRTKLLNVGLVHQSNGHGGNLERSWNRFYLEAIATNSNWLISAKPWLVFSDSSMQAHNPDITTYLGHGRLLVAYKYNKQTLSLETRNNIESGFQRGMAQLGWSFPLVNSLKGYIQIFSGYGQSLLEYDHYSKSLGIGIALNDWI